MTHEIEGYVAMDGNGRFQFANTAVDAVQWLLDETSDGEDSDSAERETIRIVRICGAMDAPQVKEVSMVVPDHVGTVHIEPSDPEEEAA